MTTAGVAPNRVTPGPKCGADAPNVAGRVYIAAFGRDQCESLAGYPAADACRWARLRAA